MGILTVLANHVDNNRNNLKATYIPKKYRNDAFSIVKINSTDFFRIE